MYSSCCHVSQSNVFFSMNTCIKLMVLCNVIIPACIRCVDSSRVNRARGVGGCLGGLLIVKKKEKGKAQRERRGEKG